MKFLLETNANVEAAEKNGGEPGVQRTLGRKVGRPVWENVYCIDLPPGVAVVSLFWHGSANSELPQKWAFENNSRTEPKSELHCKIRF